MFLILLLGRIGLLVLVWVHLDLFDSVVHSLFT